MAREVELSNAKLEIAAELESAPARFTAVSMKVSADYQEGVDFQKLVTIAERGCISANTLKKAVDLTISIS